MTIVTVFHPDEDYFTSVISDIDATVKDVPVLHVNDTYLVTYGHVDINEFRENCNEYLNYVDIGYTLSDEDDVIWTWAVGRSSRADDSDVKFEFNDSLSAYDHAFPVTLVQTW